MVVYCCEVFQIVNIYSCSVKEIERVSKRCNIGQIGVDFYKDNVPAVTQFNAFGFMTAAKRSANWCCGITNIDPDHAVGVFCGLNHSDDVVDVGIHNRTSVTASFGVKRWL